MSKQFIVSAVCKSCWEEQKFLIHIKRNADDRTLLNQVSRELSAEQECNICGEKGNIVILRIILPLQYNVLHSLDVDCEHCLRVNTKELPHGFITGIEITSYIFTETVCEFCGKDFSDFNIENPIYYQSYRVSEIVERPRHRRQVSGGVRK